MLVSVNERASLSRISVSVTEANLKPEHVEGHPMGLVQSDITSVNNLDILGQLYFKQDSGYAQGPML